MRCTLSTSISSESDIGLTSSQGATLPAVTNGILRFNQAITNKLLTVATKTPYNLLSFYGIGGASASSLAFRGDLAPTVIKLESSYL